MRRIDCKTSIKDHGGTCSSHNFENITKDMAHAFAGSSRCLDERQIMPCLTLLNAGMGVMASLESAPERKSTSISSGGSRSICCPNDVEVFVGPIHTALVARSSTPSRPIRISREVRRGSYQNKTFRPTSLANSLACMALFMHSSCFRSQASLN